LSSPVTYVVNGELIGSNVKPQFGSCKNKEEHINNKNSKAKSRLCPIAYNIIYIEDNILRILSKDYKFRPLYQMPVNVKVKEYYISGNLHFTKYAKLIYDYLSNYSQ
jgi:hypothetical protein